MFGHGRITEFLVELQHVDLLELVGTELLVNNLPYNFVGRHLDQVL